jgi:hypothetical protein
LKSWQKRIEVATNVAILCAFLMVAALATKRFFERPVDASGRGPRIGTAISLPGVDWGKSNLSLVMALSTGCHFCSESSEFYRRLVPSAANRGVRVLAVLPQPLVESRGYLEKLGVPVTEVVESPLAVLDVPGTPTLIVLDRQGRIKKAWAGKLDPEREKQVLASLQP